MNLWTVGHSNRTADEFLALLAERQIQAVVDVRTLTGSRRHPHFHAEACVNGCLGEGLSTSRFRSLGVYARNSSRLILPATPPGKTHRFGAMRITR